MRKNERIIQVIFGVVDEVNKQLPEEQQMDRSFDTVLIGRLGKLDSLGLINLIVTTEEKIEEEFKITIDLAEILAYDKETSPINNPLETIGTLIDYVSLLLEKRSNA